MEDMLQHTLTRAHLCSHAWNKCSSVRHPVHAFAARRRACLPAGGRPALPHGTHGWAPAASGCAASVRAGLRPVHGRRAGACRTLCAALRVGASGLCARLRARRFAARAFLTGGAHARTRVLLCLMWALDMQHGPVQCALLPFAQSHRVDAGARWRRSKGVCKRS